MRRIDKLSETNLVVKLSDNTTDAHLKSFWDEFSSDNSRFGTYMDNFSYLESFEKFVKQIIKDEMEIWPIMLNTKMVGAVWLHDILQYRDSRSAWMGIYHFRELRGIIHHQGLHLGFKKAHEIGIPHLFGGTRCCNQIAKKFAISGGWNYLGDVPEFGWFDGVLDGLSLLSLNIDDRDEAWRQAEMRAKFNRTHTSSLVGVDR